MPPKRKISIYKPFVTPWKKGDVYVHQIKENPPLDEAYNPPRSYQQYVGWYITIYVHDIIEEDVNMPGIPDLFPIVYLAFSEQKPKSITDIDNLSFVYYTIREKMGGSVLRDYEFKIIDNSIKRYPRDLDYLGNVSNFREFKDQHQKGYYDPYWWNTIETYVIRGYEDAIEEIKNQN